MWEICSKLLTETCPNPSVFIDNFEQISQIALMFALLTLNKQMPAGSVAQNLLTISNK